MKEKLIEGKDYYYSEQGYLVLTEGYHREKGVCCGLGCRHCPYNYVNVPEPRRAELLHASTAPQKMNEQDCP